MEKSQEQKALDHRLIAEIAKFAHANIDRRMDSISYGEFLIFATEIYLMGYRDASAKVQRIFDEAKS